MTSKAEVMGKIDLRIREHEEIISMKRLKKNDPDRVFREGNINGLKEVRAWVMQLGDKQ